MEVFEFSGNFDFRNLIKVVDFYGLVVANDDNNFFKGTIIYPNLGKTLAICGNSNYRSLCEDNKYSLNIFDKYDYSFNILALSSSSDYRPVFATGYAVGKELTLTSPYDFTGLMFNNPEKLGVWRKYKPTPKEIKKIKRNFYRIVGSGSKQNRELEEFFESKGFDEFYKFYFEEIIKKEIEFK